MSHPLIVTRSERHPLSTFSKPTFRRALDFLQKTFEFTLSAEPMQACQIVKLIVNMRVYYPRALVCYVEFIFAT